MRNNIQTHRSVNTGSVYCRALWCVWRLGESEKHFHFLRHFLCYLKFSAYSRTRKGGCRSCEILFIGAELELFRLLGDNFFFYILMGCADFVEYHVILLIGILLGFLQTYYFMIPS